MTTSTITKNHIVEKIQMGLNCTKIDAKNFVDVFFAEISNGLNAGHHVRLSGFGNFCLRDKSERPGRNPKTGEDIPIQARRVVTFRAGHKLRGVVENQAIQNLNAGSQTNFDQES